MIAIFGFRPASAAAIFSAEKADVFGVRADFVHAAKLGGKRRAHKPGTADGACNVQLSTFNAELSGKWQSPEF